MLAENNRFQTMVKNKSSTKSNHIVDEPRISEHNAIEVSLLNFQNHNVYHQFEEKKKTFASFNFHRLNKSERKKKCRKFCC